jgi:hypothetical protein
MRRGLTILLISLLLTLPAALAVAGTAAYGTARRQAIQAVNACRNLATVSRQLDKLAADVETESQAIQAGTSGRIAVIRERLGVIDGKVGEMERKVGELQQTAADLKTSTAELEAGIASP